MFYVLINVIKKKQEFIFNFVNACFWQLHIQHSLKNRHSLYHRHTIFDQPSLKN